MRFDLHVHTSVSACSTLALGDILTHAKQFGLQGVCLTDHDTMAIRHQIQEGIQADGLCVIIGMEYETSDGDVLIFGPYEDLTPGLPARVLFDHVRTTGGAAIVAHPFRPGRSCADDIGTDRLPHAGEAFNGRNTPTANLQAQTWLSRNGIAATGGSDAHTLEELGRVVTRFSHPIRTRNEFIAALHSRTFTPEITGRAPAAWRQKHKKSLPMCSPISRTVDAGISRNF